MTRHYDTLHTEDTQGFHIVCSTTWEDTPPQDMFDASVEDIGEIHRKIDNGTYEWFAVRVEAYQQGILLGTDFLGCCLYESQKDFLADAYYEDMVYNAIKEAKSNLAKLCADSQGRLDAILEGVQA